MISGIDLDHVAVALERQADAWPRYAGDLGGAWHGGGPSPGFDWGTVRFTNGMKVEVLQPARVEQNDFLRRFLDRNGPGPHHLTFKVKDIHAAMKEASDSGYRPVSVDLSDPHWQEAFLHPKDAPGVVVQLAQPGGDGEWTSPLPAEFPSQARNQAVLLHVAHSVASLDDGLRFFRDLLAGHEADAGDGWVELAWPGPGRVRLLAMDGDPWLQGRAGRVHHLHFACDEPAAVPDATANGDGTFTVAPENNAGVRLVLEPTG